MDTEKHGHRISLIFNHFLERVSAAGRFPTFLAPRKKSGEEHVLRRHVNECFDLTRDNMYLNTAMRNRQVCCQKPPFLSHVAAALATSPDADHKLKPILYLVRSSNKITIAHFASNRHLRLLAPLLLCLSRTGSLRLLPLLDASPFHGY